MKSDLFTKNDKIIVAVSGGPDSICLLHMLYTNNYNIYVVHFNHMLRETAINDTNFVIDFCNKLKIDYEIINIDVKTYTSENKLSTEEAAREMRYSNLYDIAKKINANKIALGHNLNDKIETILMNIVRGSGINGLCALKYEQNMLVRPLLDTSREEILEYLKENNLSYCIDETNNENIYTRNKFRNIIIPELTKINSNLNNNIVRLSNIASDTNDFIEVSTDKIINDIVTVKDNISYVDIESFIYLHKVIRLNIIKRLITNTKETTKDISYAEIIRLDELIKEKKDVISYLDTGKLFARINNNKFSIEKEKEIFSTSPFFYKLDVETDLYIKELDITIVWEKISNKKIMFNKNKIYLTDDLVKDLTVSNIDTSKRFRQLGMKGTKKIQDILVDKKIPIENRYKNFMISNKENVLWIPNVVLSEYAKIADKDKITYCLKIKSEN